MARFYRLEVLNAVVELGLIPMFYHPDLETVKQIVSACRQGGVRVVEFTNRGDFAIETFSALSQYVAKVEPDVILGVGSIVDASTAAMYIAAGANFIVAPSLNPDVARLCNRRKVAFMPGCGSVTEISNAEELGAEIVKIFPGKELGGPAFVKALLGPSPWTRILATGGVDVTRDNIQAWFDSGVTAVGIGSNLFKKELISGKKFDDISSNVSKLLEWIQEVRKAK